MDMFTAFGEAYTHYVPTSRRASPSRQPSFNYYSGGGSGTAPHHSSTSAFANGNGNSGRHDENQHQPPPPPLQPQAQQQQQPQHKTASDQAYRETFASHERAVFQEEVRARMRRRDAARNRALFRGRVYKRPEFYAITLGFLGLLYPIINQYVVQPWLERSRHKQLHGGLEL